MPSGVYKRRKGTFVGKNPNSRNGWEKGQNYPGMKGKKHTEKAKQKMAKFARENPVRYWLGKKRDTPWMRKRVVSEETRRKMSLAKKGTKMPPRTKQHLDNLSKNNARYWLGKKQTLSTRKKRSDATVGIMPKNNLYLGKYGNVQRGWFNIGNNTKGYNFNI